jgi:hypothetical protein
MSLPRFVLRPGAKFCTNLLGDSDLGSCCCCCCRLLQVGFFDDKVGPITLACIVMVTLVAITIMAFIDVFS